MLGSGSDRVKAAVELTGQSEKLGRREVRMSLVFLVSLRISFFDFFLIGSV